MKTKYKHLNCEERTLIQLSLERGCTMNAIALSLDRSVSSISRALARNGWCDPKSQPAQAGRRALAAGYRAVIAHQRAALSRSTGRKPARLAINGFLWSQVQKLLR
jgi:IS30 family transposase